MTIRNDRPEDKDLTYHAPSALTEHPSPTCRDEVAAISHIDDIEKSGR